MSAVANRDEPGDATERAFVAFEYGKINGARPLIAIVRPQRQA